MRQEFLDPPEFTKTQSLEVNQGSKEVGKKMNEQFKKVNERFEDLDKIRPRSNHVQKAISSQRSQCTMSLNIIEQTFKTDSLGDAINISNPYSFFSSSSKPMIVIDEYQHDDIQFTIGPSIHQQTTGPATCSKEGWDPKQVPTCGRRFTSDMKAICTCFPPITNHLTLQGTDHMGRKI